jgi:hypothetical protein
MAHMWRSGEKRMIHMAQIALINIKWTDSLASGEGGWPGGLGGKGGDGGGEGDGGGGLGGGTGGGEGEGGSII